MGLSLKPRQISSAKSPNPSTLHLYQKRNRNIVLQCTRALADARGLRRHDGAHETEHSPRLVDVMQHLYLEVRERARRSNNFAIECLVERYFMCVLHRICRSNRLLTYTRPQLGYFRSHELSSPYLLRHRGSASESQRNITLSLSSGSQGTDLGSGHLAQVHQHPWSCPSIFSSSAALAKRLPAR